MPNDQQRRRRGQRSGGGVGAAGQRHGNTAANPNPRRGGGRQARRWCFTINNYTGEHEQHLRGIPENPEHIRRIIAGREVGASGTPHIQGYVEFDRPTRLGAVKTAIGAGTAHVEVANGTAEQNEEYCSKENDIIIDYGSNGRRRQGQRSDLSEVKSVLDNGGGMRDVAQVNFGAFLRYQKGLEAYSRLLRSQPRDFVTQVVWFYGPTGTGKSRRAAEESMALSGGDVAWIGDQTLQWFEPYAGHKAAVIDDFDGRTPLSVLLRLFDRYPMLVPVKGSFVQWRPRIVWITSNFKPEDLYGAHDQWSALQRRLTEVTLIE